MSENSLQRPAPNRSAVNGERELGRGNLRKTTEIHVGEYCIPISNRCKRTCGQLRPELLELRQQRERNLMTIDSIIASISNGEPINITINGFKNGALDSFRAWLAQFRNICGGGKQCITCNTYTTRAGDQRLEIAIGVIPNGQRQLLAGTLRSMYGGGIFTGITSR